MTPDEAKQLLMVARPMLKGHIRQTRNLLAVLAQLDSEFDALARSEQLREIDRMALGGAATDGKTENGTLSGSPRATVRV